MSQQARSRADTAIGRRALVAALGIGVASVLAAGVAHAQQHSGGGDDGHGGGGHGGGGGGGGGDDGGGGGVGKTPQQRAVRHRARFGQTLGGGENMGGHGGGRGGGHGGGHGGEGGVDDNDNLSDGTIAGGATGAEHFVHDSPGYWGVDGKVLRR